jgi:hypothetical protein
VIASGKNYPAVSSDLIDTPDSLDSKVIRSWMRAIIKNKKTPEIHHMAYFTTWG